MQHGLLQAEASVLDKRSPAVLVKNEKYFILFSAAKLSFLCQTLEGVFKEHKRVLQTSIFIAAP